MVKKTAGINKVLILSILTIFTITALGSLIYLIIFFPNKHILQVFYWRWILNNTLDIIIIFFIPLSVLGIFISFSLIIPRISITETKQYFYKIINPVFILFVILTLLYTVLQEGIRPGLSNRKEELLYLSEQGKDYLKKIDAAVTGNNFEEAAKYTEEYLYIDPENPVIRENLSIIQSRIRPVFEKEEEREEIKPKQQVLDQTPLSLFNKAKEYFDKEDYFSAHYYANLAFKLNQRLTEAGRLASLAWEKIGLLEKSQQDEKLTKLFRIKKEGYTALQEQRPIEAYYIFTQLHLEYPKDPDIIKYLSISEEEIKNLAFFTDEALKALTLPGTRIVVFLNKNNDTESELIFFNKIVDVQSGVYVQGIEAMAFSKTGEILYHLSAEYGKINNTTLLLHSIHREKKEIQQLPVYRLGQRMGADYYSIKLKPSVRDLSALSLNTNSFSHVNLPDLWKFSNVLSGYGFRREPVQHEILLRVLMPFTFLIAALFSAALGWLLRVKEKKPSLFSYLFIPAIPFIVQALLQLYLYANKLLLGFLLLVLGFWITLIILVILQALLIFISLIILAGQSTS